MNSLEIFSRVILLNELGGSTAHIYKFSDADGIRSGKSGWSFGLCQFDINNNPQAIVCLRDCNFTTDEIAGLKAQTVPNMKQLNTKLLANCTIIDRYDDQQLSDCIQVPTVLCGNSGIKLTDGGLIALADYHNQFYMSRGGKMHSFLKAEGGRLKAEGKSITAEDIYRFKLTTLWGQKRPDDVKRRHENIMAILRGDA